MNIERHVTSLELSKRLKELGVPQESEYVWDPEGNVPTLHLNLWDPLSGVRPHFSAFLASELGEMLPKGNTLVRHDDEGNVVPWTAGCVLDYPTNKKAYGHGVTEPDARAKLLIHLIARGIVDPKALHAS